MQTKHNINRKQGHDDKETTGENSSVVEVEPQGPMEKYLKKETMAKIVAKLVAMDGFSIHSISHSCFIRDSFSLRSFSLPKNHKTIMKLVIEFYNEKQSELSQYFQCSKKEKKKFSLTLDEWTSKRNRRYINVNIHGVDRKQHNLGLIRIYGSCPAEKAVALVEQRLNEFSLNFTDIVGCTTDGQQL